MENLVGKLYFRQVTKSVTWKVEVIADSLTHVYIKILEPNTGARSRAWNVSKSWFLKNYTECERK
jgi:hypothetical protein